MKSSTQAWVRRITAAGVVVLAATAAQAQQGGYSVVAGTQSGPSTIGVVPSAAGETRTRTRTMATQRLDDGRVHRPEEYGGITPGMPNLAPGFRRLARLRNVAVPVVAWPGFQMLPGGSRVFVAMTRPGAVTESRSNLQRVFHITGARVALSNNRRPLITESVATPLRRAFRRTSRGGVDLVLQLRAETEARTSQDAGPQGLSFLYVDFPPFAPPDALQLELPNGRTQSIAIGRSGVTNAVLPRPRSVRPNGPGLEVAEPPLGVDNERPPMPQIGRAVRRSNTGE